MFNNLSVVRLGNVQYYLAAYLVGMSWDFVPRED